MARLVLADPLTFLQMLGSLPGEDPSKNLDRLMDSWWRQVRISARRFSLDGKLTYVWL